MGTPHYMSPEQAQDSATVDPRSDIYSLGIVLYHCLTGAPPFQGSNLYQIIRQHVEKEIPTIQFNLLESNLAQNVNQLLRKMTQKRKEDRYATVDLLMKDLALIMTSLQRMSQDDVLVLSPQIQGFDQDEDFKVFQSGLDAKAPTQPADSAQDQEWFKTYVASDLSTISRSHTSKNTDLILFLISLIVCIVVLYFMHQAGIF
jgi:serine/threonine protein kinase